ncbi:hypothetical protein EJ02DRAFT_365086 [Clathrospora elynae]|uniref:Uncharacterized protein n=1 Tax=Clathrospora elynae TaxID=706981 RepID=A0A6A5T9W0_9PLEO|nr:hypothetical protein EJ02DRAFT_365086 [Clathrospora elynae]
MVSTRRSTANADSATAGTANSKPAQPVGETIHFTKSSRKRTDPVPVTPKISSAVLFTAPSGNISEHDMSLTSPTTGEILDVTMSTPKTQQGSSRLPERTVSSALRRLAPKPFGDMSGSSHNPIIVIEDSSPFRPAPRPTIRAPKRKQKHLYRPLPEPHQFIDNGYRKLYSYRVSRAALAPMPANGSTFTGHQSHDIYRMMNAKMAVAPGVSPNAAWGHDTRNVPFEVQYPLSAQILAQQQQKKRTNPASSPYAQYYQFQALSGAHPMTPSRNEELLRKKAVQYIRESSKLSPRKRRLSDADPDETSADESEPPATTARLSPSTTATPRLSVMSPNTPHNNVSLNSYGKLNVFQDPDSNFDVNHLIEHTSLVTSLLQIYPHSMDQKGLRQDISMLVSVQNLRMAEWLNADSQISRKRRKSDTDSAIGVSSNTTTKVQNEQDSVLRLAFSANADMWRDGTGEGVADVFAVALGSSPVASFDENIPTHKDKILSPVKKAEYVDGKSAAADDSVILESKVSSPRKKDLSPDVKPPTPNAMSKKLNSTSASPGAKMQTPIGNKSVHPVIEASSPLSKSAQPNSKTTTPNKNTSHSDPKLSSPASIKTSTANFVDNPSGSDSDDGDDNKPDSPKSPRFFTRRQRKKHLSASSSSSSQHIFCMSPGTETVRQPTLRFQRRGTVHRPVATLKQQDTTSSIEKVDAEFRVLTAQYLETNGLGVRG